ncbi:MAG: patatin-like phospholipase family protein [Anaerolineales bacterium]|nr:patatin-like phospholipase family protein [Anaerolineales bacterium]
MNIGMALSGGGYRATVFHLGVLEWFARIGHLGDVKFLSTISGGSICIGLVFAANDNKWPTDEEYRSRVVPQIRKWMTEVDLQRAITIRGILNPFSTRADDLARLMEKKFDMKGTLQHLPDAPRWIINSTTYETGVLFRMEKRYMADYKLGGVKNPRLKISEAVAASAGFPVGIGPLILEPADYSWMGFENGVLQKPIPTPSYKKLHLWDGGLYDNLGDESLTNSGEGWRKGIDFLVVSDASGMFNDHEEYSPGVEPLKRLLDVTTSQVRAIRSRALVEYMDQHPGTGIYLQIDNTVEQIMEDALQSGLVKQPAPHGALSHVLNKVSVKEAATMGTHIHDLEADEFELLFRQGFEVANATYYGYINADRWLNFN